MAYKEEKWQKQGKGRYTNAATRKIYKKHNKKGRTDADAAFAYLTICLFRILAVTLLHLFCWTNRKNGLAVDNTPRLFGSITKFGLDKVL